MATKKRKTSKRVSRQTRRLSRVKAPRKKTGKKHVSTKRKTAPTRRIRRHQPKSNQRKRPARKHQPASKRDRATRKQAKPHRRKAVKHREPLRKTPSRAKTPKRTPERERIERLERELRQTRQTLRDLERTPAARRIRETGGGGGRDEGPTFETPRGAIERVDSSGNIVIELPEYTGPTFDEIDWGDWDFDDVYDDVGDEDEDSYGEDAT